MLNEARLRASDAYGSSNRTQILAREARGDDVAVRKRVESANVSVDVEAQPSAQHGHRAVLDLTKEHGLVAREVQALLYPADTCEESGDAQAR